MAEPKDALKERLAGIAEKYSAAIEAMEHKELLDELEKRALMASYGTLDPTTAMLLKMAKAELLQRLKGSGTEKPESPTKAREEEATKEATRPTLFG